MNAPAPLDTALVGVWLHGASSIHTRTSRIFEDSMSWYKPYCREGIEGKLEWRSRSGEIDN